MSTEHADLPTAARVRRLEERLVDAGLASDEELDRVLSRFLSQATPANGARLVARAWTDGEFRELLLTDANTAIGELDLSMGGGLQEQRLEVVANTYGTHNLIVCTLCSCYPLSLLGPSPSWYKSEAYRARAVREPRAVLAEFGLRLGGNVGIAVWDSSAETRYMVLPVRPEGTADMPEEDLAALVTREGMIGTAAV